MRVFRKPPNCDFLLHPKAPSSPWPVMPMQMRSPGRARAFPSIEWKSRSRCTDRLALHLFRVRSASAARRRSLQPLPKEGARVTEFVARGNGTVALSPFRPFSLPQVRVRTAARSDSPNTLQSVRKCRRQRPIRRSSVRASCPSDLSHSSRGTSDASLLLLVSPGFL